MTEEKGKNEELQVNPAKGREYVPDSAGAGNSDRITREYLDHMLLVYRHIGAVEPDTSCRILGVQCQTPIMASALALLDRMREGGPAEFAKGILRAGSVMWTGWIDTDLFRRVCDTGVGAVCGIKPFADSDKIFDAIEKAADCGAIACCMDIDHCFDDTGADCGFIFGQLSHKSREELKSYADFAKERGLPFILKGILDPEDAKAAKTLGTGGIVASHHKGIWSYAVPPAMVLPEIRAAVGPDYPVFSDCCVQSGVDAYKNLAAGSDAVGVARELMTAFRKNGADGVYDRMMFMTDELRGTMAKTHCNHVSDIDMSHIRMRTGW